MKQFLKRRKLIFLFRFFALIDVLFYDKFELKVYTKHGLNRTKFDKKEILKAKL